MREERALSSSYIAFMASLSQAPFASSNTEPVASPKLLSPHLSMDPAAPSSSQLSNPSAAYWLQKAPPSSTTNIMQQHSPPFNGIGSPFYDAYSNAGDSCIEQGFTGGDFPLLTSSWEALDRLVSASMVPAASGTATDQLNPELAGPQYGVQYARSTLHSAGSAISGDVDHKPLSALYGSYGQKSRVEWAASNPGASSSTSNTPASSNVGLNLASFISADPGFVERAAKFSSYSQQINSQQAAAPPYSSLRANLIDNSNPVKACHRDYTDGTHGIKMLSNYRIANHLTRSVSCNVGLAHNTADSSKNQMHAPINHSDERTMNTTAHKNSSSPVASTANLSGSKKKREMSIKDGEVDDSGADFIRKRPKEEHEDQDASNGSNNSGKMNGKVIKQSKVAAGSAKTKQNGRSNSGESEPKSEVCNNKTLTPSPSPSPSPSPKPDFIHVRARRGQATDSHSLAERVRREKISERMKYLQDLVPGCTKVTGKAMMLDEIINYVQSLQRQVEFLSMKLAAVHPSKLEFNFETLFGKEVVQQPTLPHMNLAASLLSPLLTAAAADTPTPNILHSSSPFQQLHAHPVQSLYHHQQQQQPHQQHNTAFSDGPSLPSSGIPPSFGSDAALRRTLSMLAAASSDNFGECISQISADTWGDDDLQNIMPGLG